MFAHYFKHFDNDIFVTFLFFACIFLALAAVWDIYFVKMILYYTRLYRESIKEAKTDILDNSLELALHYKAEIVKYAFLLAINVIESIGLITYHLTALIPISAPIDKIINNCTTARDIYNFHNYRLIPDPITTVTTAVGELSLLFSLSLVICLMKYLDVTYHDIHGKSFQYIRKFLLVTFLVGIFLIITGSIPQLFILQKLSELSINLVLFCIWVKQTRTFYKTLKWRSVEYRIRGVSCQIVTRSAKSCYHFAVFMSMVGMGFLSVVSSIIVQKCFFLIAIALRYGPCLFHRVYGTSHYEPLLTTKQQIEAFNISREFVLGIATTLLVVAYLSFGLQYLTVTFVFFGGKLWKSLKYRFGRVRTRFTPSLMDPLLLT